LDKSFQGVICYHRAFLNFPFATQHIYIDLGVVLACLRVLTSPGCIIDASGTPKVVKPERNVGNEVRKQLRIHVAFFFTFSPE
jgi:hypothetical protein